MSAPVEFVKLTPPPITRNPKPVFTAAERQAHIEAWKQTGLNLNQYCKQTGFSISTLSKWNRDLNKAYGKPSTQSIHSESVTSFNGRGIEILLPNELRIRFNEKANLIDIVKLLKAIQKCS